MGRFWSGFGLASALWAGSAAYLVYGMGYGPPVEVIEVASPEVEAAPVEEAVEEAPRRRGRARRPASDETPTGDAVTGDDLREGELRMVEGAGEGGEQSISGDQIEAAFDRAMGRYRRCFVLMAGGDPVTGRLNFGLRVAPTGRVTAVQLSGPAAATTGEAGECIQATARGMIFAPFDGPEALVRYYITLE